MSNIDDYTYELISAYIDGEVSADEQARVEQLLSGSDECRQLCDELLAIRGNLQLLPSYKIGDGFHDRIVALIEESAGTPPVATLSAPRPAATTPETHPRRLVVGAVSLIVTVAAVVALMFHLASRSADDLAQPPADATPHDVAPGPNVPGESAVAENTPGEKALPQSPDPLETPEIDGTETQFVSLNPAFAKREFMALMVELIVAPEAVKDEIVQRALTNHGVAFANDIDVDEELGESILSHRMLKKNNAEEKEPLDGESVQLTYVETTCGQADAVIRQFWRGDHRIKRVRFDLAIVPDEYTMFQQMHAAKMTDIAGAAVPRSEDNPGPITSLARRLVVDEILQSQLIRNLGSLALLSYSSLPAQEARPTPPRHAEVPIEIAKQEEMKNKPCAILILVRYAN